MGPILEPKAAKKLFCPVTGKKCKADGCMAWVAAPISCEGCPYNVNDECRSRLNPCPSVERNQYGFCSYT